MDWTNIQQSKIYRLPPYNINVMPFPMVPMCAPPPMFGFFPHPTSQSSPPLSLDTSKEDSEEEPQSGVEAKPEDKEEKQT